MERRPQQKKRYLSASYLTSGAVFYGTLLFLIARIFTLAQLFSDAYTRKKLEQAPPENFTFFGVLGYVLVIAIIGLAFYLLLKNRQGKLKIKQRNLYLLLNALFAIWGVINAVGYLVEMILFFEFVYLLDFLTLIAALVVPSVLYQLSDRKQDIPPDNVLFYSAIGATALSTLAALIVALVLRKSYTTFQLTRELMFRAGIILFGVAGLLKAIRLRADLPALVAAMPKAAPKPAKPKPEPQQKLDIKGRIRCPDCGKKLPAETRICPRCGYDIETPSLFDDEEEFDEIEPDDAPLPDEPDEPEKEIAADEPEEDAFEAPVPAAPVRQELPKEICPRCNKKKPPFLSTCPHCGYYPGDPIELAQEEERLKQSAETGTQAAPAAVPEPKPLPKCENCGKIIPGGLATCPYCGYHPDDARAQEEPAQPEPEPLFEQEDAPPLQAPRETGRYRRPTQRLPRVPDPKRLTPRNSIVCPECGRRYSAARDVCPYCGYGLYDD